MVSIIIADSVENVSFMAKNNLKIVLRGLIIVVFATLTVLSFAGIGSVPRAWRSLIRADETPIGFIGFSSYSLNHNASTGIFLDRVDLIFAPVYARREHEEMSTGIVAAALRTLDESVTQSSFSQDWIDSLTARGRRYAADMYLINSISFSPILANVLPMRSTTTINSSLPSKSLWPLLVPYVWMNGCYQQVWTDERLVISRMASLGWPLRWIAIAEQPEAEGDVFTPYESDKNRESHEWLWVWERVPVKPGNRLTVIVWEAVAANIVIVAIALVTIWVATRFVVRQVIRTLKWRIERARIAKGLCARCGYPVKERNESGDLNGLNTQVAGKCPECGLEAGMMTDEKPIMVHR